MLSSISVPKQGPSPAIYIVMYGHDVFYDISRYFRYSQIYITCQGGGTFNLNSSVLARLRMPIPPTNLTWNRCTTLMMVLWTKDQRIQSTICVGPLFRGQRIHAFKASCGSSWAMVDSCSTSLIQLLIFFRTYFSLKSWFPITAPRCLSPWKSMVIPVPWKISRASSSSSAVWSSLFPSRKGTEP